ncbi:ribokinase [Meiothermus ruber]|jgi:ribokinase|uniref:Ribokinase n=1 Tax=Meiothermus ruber (strain ATCC 35948 / DSM 1279 / VKM B-1258 / 21) TaxID=504728 RepID=D3PL84_MEIRD|nr:ribokinase [Meiothermus ruber]ADD26980.1 ribokinase [Meiothermus ruber DSM 1279]AGK03434.1 ribokinase [Meiothermus ruber DSM 1279]MCL6530818.1 ribokinase [Meiothermus ruber]GAO73897.1 ribokinase [Meiothermus ruber H328]
MSIVVVGSINMDLVVRVKRHPVPGETLLGSDYETHHGGKGANQAVAAARMLARPMPTKSASPGPAPGVRMIGRVGQDEFGQQLRNALKREGINVSATLPIAAPTGVAFIAIDEEGQNTIIVSPGANHRLRPEHLSPAEFEEARVVVLQLEIPLETVRRAAELGRQAGAQVILNAAPAQKLPDKLLHHIDILVVNEIEALGLSGVKPDSPEMALEVAQLLAKKVPTVIITLGEQGAVWASPEGQGHQPVPEVEVVDATGAGDAFIGALAAALCEGRPLAQAVAHGCVAGALATTKTGAQSSLPWREEVCARLEL